ncbi:hypothetical protein ACFS5N_01105 [Mucilaginibacter ximonensis]|uniref:Lipoprotein n=1 Tax=Mucilaginibacter ximonensis TaxID=538021 RepID=A0ABW5Y6R4_9SPHI
MTAKSSRYFIYIIVFGVVIISACHSSKKVYLSDCDASIAFKKISYAHLLDSLNYYDKKYIDVEGRYEEGKEESALFNDSLYVHKPNDALWVNFSQDCPLYLAGTRTGFFQVDGGGSAHISNKKIRIRGKLDLNNHGAHKLYKGCIDHVSFIEL